MVMALSDLVIGGYTWQMMLLVYAMLALPVALRSFLRRQLTLTGDQPKWKPVAGLLGCSLGASLAFFLVTNFGSWLWFGMYENSLAGLLACYTAAVPFFRYTLAGDLVFACLLFGGYARRAELGPAAGICCGHPRPRSSDSLVAERPKRCDCGPARFVAIDDNACITGIDVLTWWSSPRVLCAHNGPVFRVKRKEGSHHANLACLRILGPAEFHGGFGGNGRDA